jgi:hypothetical protein
MLAKIVNGMVELMSVVDKGCGVVTHSNETALWNS